MALAQNEIVELRTQIVAAIAETGLGSGDLHRVVNRVADREMVFSSVSGQSIWNWSKGEALPSGWWLPVVFMAVNEELERQGKAAMLPHMEPGSVRAIIESMRTPPKKPRPKAKPRKRSTTIMFSQKAA